MQFNSVDFWIAFGTSITVSSNVTALYDPSKGPFGVLRIDATAITVGSITSATIVGYPTSVKL